MSSGVASVVFDGSCYRDHLEHRARLVGRGDRAVHALLVRIRSRIVRIERRPVRHRQQFAGVRILHDYRPGLRLRLLDRARPIPSAAMY